MSKQPEISPELQIEINRQLWIQALRDNGHRQCRGPGNKGGEVCALALALEIAHLDTKLLWWPYLER